MYQQEEGNYRLIGEHLYRKESEAPGAAFIHCAIIPRRMNIKAAIKWFEAEEERGDRLNT